jgi:biopolymer transport protein ExbD
MKHLTLVFAVVAVVACSKKDSAAPDPKPVEPKPEPVKAEVKPPEPKPEPPKPAEPCVVKVSVGDKISFEGGGVKGESPTDAVDLSAVKPLAGKCTAEVTAPDTQSYQKVVTVMDKLVAAGITDVSIESGAPDAKPTPAPKTIDPKDAVKTAPVIIITKTDVKIANKAVGKVKDTDKLADAIAKALPPNPKEATVILQADESLTFATIRAAIAGSKKAGYDNVLFAVKNK